MPNEPTKQPGAATAPSSDGSPMDTTRELADLLSIWNVVDRRQAVIEFDATGRILQANNNFLESMGYSAAELEGKHHSIFCTPEYSSSEAYKQFWEKLASGAHHEGQFSRLTKDGKPVWLQAIYSPVLDTAGRVVKVIKLATDITEAHRGKLEAAAKIEAINRVQAVIEFDLNGIILAANDNFLQTTGYTTEEIVGRHHRMFCDDSYARSAAYREFWEKLGRGESDSGEYKRFGKDNREVWLQASYNPVLNEAGEPFKIIKYATDITKATDRNAEYEAKVTAMNRAQAVVEFDLRGAVLDANQIFLDLMGYKLEEIMGQHHRMFCDPAFAASNEYRDLWEKLAAGHYVAVETKRYGKNNKEIWIQGTYNPVLNRDGKVIKVVKFATDITERKLTAAEYQGRLNAISKSQAVIEFDLEGNILEANQNFLDVMGYTLRELVGKHHKIFCDPEYVASDEYRRFWSKLSRGEYYGGRYLRVGKLGHRIWLQATYSPVLDAAGKPYKVVKYASDITAQVNREAEVVQKGMRIRARNTEIDQTAQALKAGIQGSTVQTAERGKTAESGARLLTRSGEAIKQVSKISNDINDIVKNVGEAASQTNLLAFNAAIEAARAGQHGLGFAVVADEVRKLAERSSQAAKDISRLLIESQNSVQSGGEIFREAEDVFRTITEKAERSAQELSVLQCAVQKQLSLTSEIATVTRELIGDKSESAASIALNESPQPSSFESLEAALKT